MPAWADLPQNRLGRAALSDGPAVVRLDLSVSPPRGPRCDVPPILQKAS